MPGQRFKCHHCSLIIAEDALDKDGLCPICLQKPVIMCVADHPCHCWNTVNPGIHFCKICGKPTCPCGSHDCVVVSRVTGYLSDVAGWNSAKRQELKDRHRVNIG